MSEQRSHTASASAVHFKTGNVKGDWALCIDGWNSSRNIRKARALTDARAAVTCKTCIRMLKAREAQSDEERLP